MRFDADAGLLRIEMAGFWSSGILAAFGDRLLLEIGQLTLAGKRFGVLSDARRFPVQAPDVAQGFEALSRNGARRHDGRTAIVLGSQLAKMQAERVLSVERLQVFLDMDAAEAWLAEGPR